MTKWAFATFVLLSFLEKSLATSITAVKPEQVAESSPTVTEMNAIRTGTNTTGEISNNSTDVSAATIGWSNGTIDSTNTNTSVSNDTNPQNNPEEVVNIKTANLGPAFADEILPTKSSSTPRTTTSHTSTITPSSSTDSLPGNDDPLSETL